MAKRKQARRRTSRRKPRGSTKGAVRRTGTEARASWPKMMERARPARAGAGTDERALKPVLDAIIELRAKIHAWDARTQEDKWHKARTYNFLEAIRTALICWCEPTLLDYYYYEFP